MRMSPLPDARLPSSSPIGSDRFEYANEDFYNVQPGDDDWYDAPDLYNPETHYSPTLYFPTTFSPNLEQRAADPGSNIPPAASTPPDMLAHTSAAPANTRKTAKKRSKKAAAHAVLDDEALDTEMKRLILEDDALYLRILRYEVCAQPLLLRCAC